MVLCLENYCPIEKSFQNDLFASPVLLLL